MLSTQHQRPTPNHRRRAFSRAFSLVELVLVLLLLGVIAAIAAPRLSASMERSRALAAAQRVAADLEAARSAAMAASASRKVIFAPAKSAYGGGGLAGVLDRGSGTYVVDLSRAPYNSTIPAASFGDSTSLRWTGVYDLDAAQEVVFDGFGRPDTEGWIVTASGGSYYKVALDRTGRTSISRVTRDQVNGDISTTVGVVVGDAK